MLDMPSGVWNHTYSWSGVVLGARVLVCPAQRGCAAELGVGHQWGQAMRSCRWVLSCFLRKKRECTCLGRSCRWVLSCDLCAERKEMECRFSVWDAAWRLASGETLSAHFTLFLCKRIA